MGQVLNGTNPGDIPFDQVTRLELAVNLKTAKSLGLEFPAAGETPASQQSPGNGRATVSNALQMAFAEGEAATRPFKESSFTRPNR
jgi:ABC-type uncharacterized transport system substrate-binding protein